MSKPGAFDIFRLMGQRGDNALMAAPLSNVSQVRKVKAGTLVTIGVAGDMVGAFARGELVGGLIFVDRAVYERYERELQAERDSLNAEGDVPEVAGGHQGPEAAEPGGGPGGEGPQREEGPAPDTGGVSPAPREGSR